VITKVNPLQLRFYLSIFLFSCKQAWGKIRAHISGPWSCLQPVCHQHYTFLKKYRPNSTFSSWCRQILMSAILYPMLQWVTGTYTRCRVLIIKMFLKYQHWATISPIWNQIVCQSRES